MTDQPGAHERTDTAVTPPPKKTPTALKFVAGAAAAIGLAAIGLAFASRGDEGDDGGVGALLPSSDASPGPGPGPITLCRDGSTSNSIGHGTCSWHGGVAA